MSWGEEGLNQGGDSASLSLIMEMGDIRIYVVWGRGQGEVIRVQYN
jgi:hypothetical protein